jgi:hypothetical protein
MRAAERVPEAPRDLLGRQLLNRHAELPQLDVGLRMSLHRANARLSVGPFEQLEAGASSVVVWNIPYGRHGRYKGIEILLPRAHCLQ